MSAEELLEVLRQADAHRDHGLHDGTYTASSHALLLAIFKMVRALVMVEVQRKADQMRETA